MNMFKSGNVIEFSSQNFRNYPKLTLIKIYKYQHNYEKNYFLNICNKRLENQTLQITNIGSAK